MLIVVSKIKKMVKEKCNFHTSLDVPKELSTHVEKLVHQATHHAECDGRKTVMGRDVDSALRDFKNGNL